MILLKSLTTIQKWSRAQAIGARNGKTPTRTSEEEDVVSSAQRYAAAKAGTVQRAVLKINDKSAATNAVTFSAIDPKRADEKMYDLYYEPLDANGEIVTTSTGTVSWN